MKKEDSRIRRGDIYYADLTPVQGSEQDGIRPVLMIQNDAGNQHSPTVIVAIITSRKKKRFMPTHIFLPAFRCMHQDSVVMLEQLRTIDRSRLKEYVGHMGKVEMRQVDRGIAVSLGLNRNYIEMAKNERNRTECKRKVGSRT